MAGKVWRARGRFVFSNFVLFGLGAMTCLICLQMFATSGINDPVVYTNPEEYRLALELKQSQSQEQQQTSENNNNVNSFNDNNESKRSEQVLCGPDKSSTPTATTKPGVLDLSSSKSNNKANIHSENDAELLLKANSNNNILNNNNDITAKSLHSNTNNGRNNHAELMRSHQEELKHFEGVVALPPDNNNIDLLNDKDLLLQDDTGDGSPPGPTVWVVTPTFYRPEQKPELTRVAQALLPVSDFVHWIVIEDTSKGTETSFEELKKFLSRFQLAVTILKSLPPKSRIVGKPRGVGGRTAAIQWLRENAQEGVVYFADDDNTYDSSIFKQMQTTEKVTMWPVGLVTELGVSSPIVKNGRVVGFYDGWNGQRKFPVDMAGFAINLQLFLDNPKASMPWKAGYEEDELLQSLGITMKDIKPLANNCTEILVWHTKAVKNVWPKKPKNLSPSVASNTNLHILLKQLPHKSPITVVDTHNNSDNKGFSFLRMFFGNGL